jgi:hypothetical protein
MTPANSNQKPDAAFAVSGRTVEITDEDENLVVAFIPVETKPKP